jgi:hypothetical protein
VLAACTANHPALLAAEDPLDAILASHRKACEAFDSATGTGTFEVYRQAADEKEMKLVTKAKVDVRFLKNKYNLRFDYDTLLIPTTDRDADGKETKRLAEWKPDSFNVIADSEKWIEVTFSPRINPIGCGGAIYDRQNKPTIPWRDVAQLGKIFNPDGLVKNLGRDKLEIADLPSGIRRVSGQAKNSDKARFELDADPKLGLNIVAQRWFNIPSAEPAHSKELTWRERDGMWYVAQIVEVMRFTQDGKLSETVKSVFKYDDFVPRAAVPAGTFALAATGLLPGARVLDHRKDAPHRILYYDGVGLSPQRPR